MVEGCSIHCIYMHVWKYLPNRQPWVVTTQGWQILGLELGLSRPRVDDQVGISIRAYIQCIWSILQPLCIFRTPCFSKVNSLPPSSNNNILQSLKPLQSLFYTSMFSLDLVERVKVFYFLVVAISSTDLIRHYNVNLSLIFLTTFICTSLFESLIKHITNLVFTIWFTSTVLTSATWRMITICQWTELLTKLSHEITEM